MSDTIAKLQPHRTMYLQGVDAYGANGAMHSATATGFAVTGKFYDPADFAILVLWWLDDYFGHPRFAYLPNSNFTGMVLDFDVTWTGLRAFESPKFASIDWPTLNCLPAGGGAEVQQSLLSMATGPGGRTGASGVFTLNTAAPLAQFDRVTLWYQNLAFDFIVPATIPTLAAICANIAAQINAVSWGSNGPLALTAVASGATITITAPPGADGNMVGMYALSKNSDLYFTVGGAGAFVGTCSLLLTGGSSDGLTWHIHVDFSALGWTAIQKLWLTFAPELAIGAAYTPTEWAVTFSNWTVTDPGGVAPLAVAGPGSVRIEETDSWVTWSGFWEQAPAAAGPFSQGYAVRAAATGASATVATYCSQVSDIYIGTRTDVDCGIVRVAMDGGAPVSIDCYTAGANAQARVRRLAFSGVSAGLHTLAITVTGTKNAASGGYYYYFDFVERAVVSYNVPDSTALLNNVAVSADFDTQHSSQLPPARLIWMIRKLGTIGPVDFYCGVFGWKQAIAVGGAIPSVAIACTTASDAFVVIAGTSLGKTMFPSDTPETVATHFALFINGLFPGVWATTDGAGNLIVSCASASYGFTVSASGGASVTSGSLSGGAAPVWSIDETVTPVLNRGFRDWCADFFGGLAAASMSAVAAFSQELVEARDRSGVVFYQRYPDGTPVITATGLGTLNSSQCAFSSTMQSYMQQAYDEMATLMEAAGLVAWLQLGEISWWYFAGGSPAGMAFYDSYTVAAAATALGRALHVFLTPADAPGAWPADVAFLAGQVASYVAGLQSYVQARHAAAKWELLWPLDANEPVLLMAVNLPAAWKTHSGSGFDSFLIEGLGFTNSLRDVNQSAACAAYAFTVLSWDKASCGYLMGIFDPGAPWSKDYLTAARTGVPVVKTFAIDQACTMGRMAAPLPQEARRLAVVGR